MSSSFNARARIGDSVPYSERTNLGQKKTKDMLARMASIYPDKFEQYRWTLKYGGELPKKTLEDMGFANATDITQVGVNEVADAIYRGLTPTVAAGKVKKPSEVLDETSKGLIQCLVGSIKLLDLMYTSGVYSLNELQKFAEAVAGVVVDIREDLVDEILAPAKYYDKSLDLLSASNVVKKLDKI